MGWDDIKQAMTDVRDIASHARGAGEVLRALLPERIRGRRILNEEGSAPGDGSKDAAALVQSLTDLGHAIKAAAMNDAGKVNYRSLKGSEVVRELESTSRLLAALDPALIQGDDARIAFWINLYNVLAIHGVIALDIETSVMEVPAFFGLVAYRLGPYSFTLDEIENGVMRRNAPHPATKMRMFSDKDPRVSLSPSRVDPRIHAALVCASTSCPPVRFYTEEKVNPQLDLAMGHYVNAFVQVDEAERKILMPITFRYYASDFGDSGALRAIIDEHADEDLRASLEGAYREGYKVEYRRYDWSLNAAG